MRSSKSEERPENYEDGCYDGCSDGDGDGDIYSDGDGDSSWSKLISSKMTLGRALLLVGMMLTIKMMIDDDGGCEDYGGS